jgi:hypothetical protein
MDPTLATTLAQFGVAGLIGWMWLTERRAASEREKQLTDAHTQILQDHKSIDVLLKALDDNTRAITALESTQRALIDSLRGTGFPARVSGASPEALRS